VARCTGARGGRGRATGADFFVSSTERTAAAIAAATASVDAGEATFIGSAVFGGGAFRTMPWVGFA